MATCIEVGHVMRSIGGANCGGNDGDGRCSVPVFECAKCGVCDYGENGLAAELREGCKKLGRTA